MPDETLYTKLFDLSGDALLLMDGSKILQCNQACVNILRAKNKEEVLACEPNDFSPVLQPDGQNSRKKARKMINQAIKNGSNQFEWVHQRFDGELFDAEVTLRMIDHQNKQLIYAVIRDLTPWLESKRKIDDANNRLRLIATNTDDIIWMRDLRFRYTYLSPSVERVKGWTVEECMQLKPHEVVPPEDLRRSLEILQAELKEEEKPDVDFNRSKRFQMREYCKDGSLIWTEQSMCFIRDHNNRPIGILGITRDITEQKRVLDELHGAKLKAEESERLKSAFLANMSHEIRTPLNAILGFSDLLVQDSTDVDEREQFLLIIKNSTNQLLDIITNVFDMSKLQANQMEINPEPVQIEDILNRLYGEFSALASEEEGNNNHVILDPIPSTISGPYMLDPMRITQVIRHLMANSLKFTKDGLIRVGIEMTETNQLRIYVSDTV